MASPPELPMDFDPSKPRSRVEHDGYLAMFVPDSTLEGLERFHVCIKRTYVFEPDGRLARTDVQRPFYAADQYFNKANPYEASLQWEAELGPPKARTDVIVNGICYAPGGEARSCHPEVQIGKHVHRLLVVGDRLAILRPGRDIQFTAADKFAALPVRYEHAYGGVDRQHSASPLMCPTNPIGTGYIVEPADGEEPRDRWVILPNIEDPRDLLQAKTLLVPAVQKQEVRSPAGFGWIPRFWEPRSLFAGMPENAKPFWDQLFGKVDADGKHFRAMQPEFWNGAPTGLQVPTLEGHEKIRIKHLHRTREEFSILLPMDQPRLKVAINDGAMTAVKTSLDTVQVEVEAGEVCLSWRGSIDKPEGMESVDDLKRFLMEIDGELVLPAPLIGTGFPIELMTGEFPGPDVLDIHKLLEIKGLPLPGGG